MALDALKRLSGPTALTTSAVTQYTVPGSTTATVREVHACNESASEESFTFSIGTDGPGKRYFRKEKVGAESTFDWTGNLPLDTGEIFQAFASAGTAITLVVSGVETA